MNEATMPYPWTDLLDEEPWREEDKKEWDRLERLRFLGASGSKMRTTRDAQDLMVHQHYLMQNACWLCGQPNMPYFAMGRVKMPYAERKFRCVRCRVELVYSVPLMALAQPWKWARPEGISPSTVIHHAELWQEHEVQKGLPTLAEHLEAMS